MFSQQISSVLIVYEKFTFQHTHPFCTFCLLLITSCASSMSFKRDTMAEKVPKTIDSPNWTVLDSSAVSIFVDILVELPNAVSEAKVQIFLLIVTTRCLGQRSRLPPRNSVESSHEVKKRRPAQPPLMRDTTWSLTVSLAVASQNFSRI